MAESSSRRITSECLAKDDVIGAAFLGDINNSQGQLSSDLLHTLFELTPAEDRVAVAITEGRSLNEIAGAQHVSKSTVGSQLKRVFEKVGVRRQAELVTRLMSIPPLAQ